MSSSHVQRPGEEQRDWVGQVPPLAQTTTKLAAPQEAASAPASGGGEEVEDVPHAVSVAISATRAIERLISASPLAGTGYPGCERWTVAEGRSRVKAGGGKSHSVPKFGRDPVIRSRMDQAAIDATSARDRAPQNPSRFDSVPMMTWLRTPRRAIPSAVSWRLKLATSRRRLRRPRRPLCRRARWGAAS